MRKTSSPHPAFPESSSKSPTLIRLQHFFPIPADSVASTHQSLRSMSLECCFSCSLCREHLSLSSSFGNCLYFRRLIKQASPLPRSLPESLLLTCASGQNRSRLALCSCTPASVAHINVILSPCPLPATPSVFTKLSEEETV